MSTKSSSYQPGPKGCARVVEPGEFRFAATHFDHGHIHNQIEGLVGAGGTLAYVYEPDNSKVEGVLKAHPDAKIVSDFREILEDPQVSLVTSSAIPDLRCGLGIQVMDAGKDYFTSKCPFTDLQQLAKAKAKVAETGQAYWVNYCERFANEASWYASELLRGGAIGKVVQVMNLAPHRLSPDLRPEWFFQKKRYGGIITDLGSHQCDQFLEYAGASDGAVNFARVENKANPSRPELEDFGEASFTLDTGASSYCRIDWLNPAGSQTWGDGRCFVLGTEGYLEIRKTRDLPRDGSDKIYLVDGDGEHSIDCQGRIGYPFFGKLILDCLNRTQKSITQERTFKAAEMSLKAQAFADQA